MAVLEGIELEECLKKCVTQLEDFDFTIHNIEIPHADECKLDEIFGHGPEDGMEKNIGMMCTCVENGMEPEVVMQYLMNYLAQFPGEVIRFFEEQIELDKEFNGK